MRFFKSTISFLGLFAVAVIVPGSQAMAHPGHATELGALLHHGLFNGMAAGMALLICLLAVAIARLRGRASDTA